MKTYSGKTVLVTGASSGIGKAFAELLASLGAHLILVARTESALQEQAALFKQKYGVDVHIFPCNLGIPGSALKLFEQVKKSNLVIDILINNAGFGKWGDFLEFEREDYVSMLNLNITTLVELCHLFLPDILERKGGGIINVASTAAFIPVPFASVYSASKSFVLYFSEALHGEYQDKGVTVLALCPGGTESRFASIANAQVNISRSVYEPAEKVAKTALEALLKKKSSVISGRQNHLAALLPRFLSRKSVIQISKKVWLKTIGRA
jgi:hypothetical protein